MISELKQKKKKMSVLKFIIFLATWRQQKLICYDCTILDLINTKWKIIKHIISVLLNFLLDFFGKVLCRLSRAWEHAAMLAALISDQ